MLKPRVPSRPVVRVAALLSAATLAVGGCSVSLDSDQGAGAPSSSAAPSSAATTSPAPNPSGASGDVPAALRRFYEQQLSWRSCGDGHQCTRLRVPIDYANPGGGSLTLALLKVPAQGRKQGSLVINPGGPGQSGVQYARDAGTQFGQRLLKAYDIVGFDPRGVGDSDPIDCVSDAQLDHLVALDPDPDTAAEVAQAEQATTRLARGCARRSPDLVAHVSTLDAAKDIDVLRAALGDRKLTWFGASYGTLLGATYAAEFGSHVRRMVLDGALDPSLSTVALARQQARGFETALRAYVGACVQRRGCFLGSSVDAATKRIRRFIDQVDRQPLPAGNRVLAVGNAVLGIWLPLYYKPFWPYLDTALQNAFAGDGSVLLKLSDLYTNRTDSGYSDNALEALYAVNCLDHDDATTYAQAKRLVPSFEKVSPTFGAMFAWSTPACSTWPVHTGRVPGPIHAAQAPPVVVVGTTRDPATPVEWARALAGQLKRGVLVTRNGDGHTGYHAGNSCVDSAVEDYLVDGIVPRRTVTC